MSSPKHFLPTALKIPRQQYDLIKAEYYQNLPFEKAKGHTNPYTRTKIETWSDYELYGHCYVLKQKMESHVSDIEKRYKASNDKLQRDLSTAKRDISNLKNSRKRRTRWFLLSIVALCIIFAFVHNSIVKELSVSREENSDLQLSISTLEKENQNLSSNISDLKKSNRTLKAALNDANELVDHWRSKTSSPLSTDELSRIANIKAILQDNIKEEITHRVLNNSVTSAYYIGNINSKVFHQPDCSYLPDRDNQQIFYTRKAATNAGYSSCSHCNPLGEDASSNKSNYESDFFQNGEHKKYNVQADGEVATPSPMRSSTDPTFPNP